MVLQNSETDQSDDDHSFELINSDDLRTDKTDHTDNESFEIIGSGSGDELDSRMKDIEEFDFAGNDSAVSNMVITLKGDKKRKSPEPNNSEEADGTDQSSSGESTDLWSTMDVMEVDNDYERFLRTSLMYGTTEIKVTFDFPTNIKPRKDMEIKDVAKYHVLPFLPAKSLVRFRSVSEDWDKWIVHPFLAHRQSCCFQDMSGFFCQDNMSRFFVSLDRSAYGMRSSSLLFLPESVNIRSSCNGLLLCQGAQDKSAYYVCNPVKEEFHVLPHSGYYHGEEPNLVLAFEPSLLNCGENYTVICAFQMFDHPYICFDIYNSERKSWSCSDTVCAEIEISGVRANGLYKNGVAYWPTSSGELLAFDTKNNLCGVQAICSEFKGEEGILALLDREVCYVQSYIEPSCLQTENAKKCVIEIFGGVTMCLKRRLDVEVGIQICDPQSFKVLFAVNTNFFIFYIDNMLYSCDVKNQKCELIRRNGITSTTTFIPYVNSLVSLAGSNA